MKPSRFLAELDLDDENYAGYLDDLRHAASITHNTDDERLADVAASGWDRAGKKGMLEAIRNAEFATFKNGASSGYALGRACLRLGRPQEALHYFNAALKNNDFTLMTLSYCRCTADLRQSADFSLLIQKVHDRMYLPQQNPVNVATADNPKLISASAPYPR